MIAATHKDQGTEVRVQAAGKHLHEGGSEISAAVKPYKTHFNPLSTVSWGMGEGGGIQCGKCDNVQKISRIA